MGFFAWRLDREYAISIAKDVLAETATESGAYNLNRAVLKLVRLALSDERLARQFITNNPETLLREAAAKLNDEQPRRYQSHRR
jgi:hypothetical protein